MSTPAPASLSTQVKLQNSKDCYSGSIGRLPENLASFNNDGYEKDASTCVKEVMFPRLEFLYYDATTETICFTEINEAAASSAPDSSQVAAALERMHAWVAVTTSPSALGNSLTNPPRGAATRWNTASDEGYTRERTTTENLRVDRENYTLTKKQDITTWSTQLCATGLKLAPGAKHLYVVIPNDWYGRDYQESRNVGMDVENYALRSASVLRWDLVP